MHGRKYEDTNIKGADTESDFCLSIYSVPQLLTICITTTMHSLNFILLNSIGKKRQKLRTMSETE